jgi:hypothetical protein
MRAHNETETYSERAVKAFKQKISKGLNLILVLLALSLIYFMIAPSQKFEKLEKGRRRSRKGKN